MVVHRIKVKNEPAAMKLFNLHAPMARRFANSYRRKLPASILADDLESAAMEGLWRAAVRGVDFGDGFENYAMVRIRGSIIDYLRAHDWLPRRFRESDNGAASLIYIEGPNFGFQDELSCPAAAEDEASASEEAIGVRSFLSVLSDRERQVIIRIYFREEKLLDISKTLGVSEPRVSQIRMAALKKLRDVVPPELMESVRSRG